MVLVVAVAVVLLLVPMIGVLAAIFIPAYQLAPNAKWRGAVTPSAAR